MSSKNWYILQTRANYENKVAERIREGISKGALEDSIDEVLVPVEKVISPGRGGRKAEVKRRVFPSYIVVHADVEHPAVKHLIRSIHGIVGFLGSANKPVPLSKKELDDIKAKMKEGVVVKKTSVAFKVGEYVKVVDGAFDTFSAVIEGVHEDIEKISVSIAILGRQTKVKLGYDQVEKI